VERGRGGGATEKLLETFYQDMNFGIPSFFAPGCNTIKGKE